jgi:hypothetical protein
MARARFADRIADCSTPFELFTADVVTGTGFAIATAAREAASLRSTVRTLNVKSKRKAFIGGEPASIPIGAEVRHRWYDSGAAK